MTPSRRSKTLTGSVTTHVTLAEEQQMKQRAAELGISKSEWCRRVLLEALLASQDTRLILSEMMALRTVFIRLYSDSLQGNPASDERLKMILQHADSAKLQLAEDRIQKSHSRTLRATTASAIESAS